jgi:hypothetical protein
VTSNRRLIWTCHRHPSNCSNQLWRGEFAYFPRDRPQYAIMRSNDSPAGAVASRSPAVKRNNTRASVNIAKPSGCSSYASNRLSLPSLSN